MKREKKEMGYHNDYSPRYQDAYDIYEKAKKHIKKRREMERKGREQEGKMEEQEKEGRRKMEENIFGEEKATETMYQRTELLLGKEGVSRLQNSRVIVFGIGGVGGHAVEALGRAGVGAIDLVDRDCICVSNINRQLVATWEDVGKEKVEVMKKRLLSINPLLEVRTHACFFLPDTASQFDFSQYDYVIDAIDTVTAKLELIKCAKEAKVPIISCMGAGNKLDPTRFEVADIYDTSVCPLARVMRRECKARGIDSLKVVYSKESAKKGNGFVPGSVSFVPSVAGLILAGEVIKELALSPLK